MATIKEVARKARVSVGTVSNVLSGAVPVSKRLKERVLEVIRQLDYHPNQIARSLKIRQTRMIGMVVNDITNPFVPQLVRGAENAAWRENYMLIVFNTDDQPERERQVMAVLRGRRVDGILLLAAGREHAHVAAVRDSGIPVVCLGRDLPDLSLDAVVPDSFAGARDCVRHLIGMGHHRIGLLVTDLFVEQTRQRQAGYQEALAEAHIAYDESLVVYGGFGAEDGYRGMLDLLAREPRPSAVFAANAAMALGVLRALHESNLECPQDVALAAFDDPFFAEALRPALTAVAQPAMEIGARAIELLLKRIEDPARQPTRIELATTLNIRESSASRRGAVAPAH